MDYDRWDAVLHYIFKQTQGDAWFRPDEQHISSGVAVRIANGIGDAQPEFRIFPYERKELEPFEQAVVGLNPEVAAKVRSAAVHAALADIGPEERSVYVDANTRIQILESMLHLPRAEKEQCAAFIRDERVLVVWSDSLDAIIPTCHDFEERLIKLLWRSRPAVARPGSTTGHSTITPSAPPSASASVSGHSLRSSPGARPLSRGSRGLLGAYTSSEDEEKLDPAPSDSKEREESGTGAVRRTWFGFGRKVKVRSAPPVLGDVECQGPEPRPEMLYAPVYNGIAAGLALVFMGNGIKILLQEWTLDGSFVRFALITTLPFLYCVSLFFALQLIQNVTMAIGPIAHYHQNSKYYSAVKPRPNKAVDEALPHITIQMPVYKESLEAVLAPSIESLKKAMQTYARQGGTSSIFINDDGLRLLPPAQRDERIAYYATHGVGWVARPREGEGGGGGCGATTTTAGYPGFRRAGRFKKASNMNYALGLSLRMERVLERLVREREGRVSSGSGSGGSGIVGGGTGGVADDEDLEDKALGLAIEEAYEAGGRRWRPWAANGKAIRMGEIVLLVDSDTVVPEDCLRDAAREMRECPTVAIIQHESDVMQVAHHYFENGIAYFTKRINRCISMACANGEVAPFMGHNAFLRWKALQDAALPDPTTHEPQIWSESNVSEDFDMALRLLQRGYVIRWATYSRGGFKEGVSLSVDDELNRWQKYAYGCNELLFNPLVQWWRKGPVAKQIHRFMWSKAPIHYKISMLAYMFSYYGIAASVTIGIINYILLGFQFPVDGFYMHSFEIWLATTVVFFGAGNVGYTLLEYRLGHRDLIKGFVENVMWIPFFFFFFGGLSIPISQALLAHLFSYNMTWSATIKEVERSNFFKEVPKIVKRFWFPLIVSFLIIIGMAVCSTSVVPLEWRVDSSGWAVIFPLAVASGCHILFPIVLNPWLMIFSY